MSLLDTNLDPVLSARRLTRRYGSRIGCRDVSLDLWPGEVLGIVGESGSGKSGSASVPTTKAVSKEYRNALKKAKSYSDMMHMSKKAIYDQLTSEYGENFPADAAQYAIDNLKADYKYNALQKAKSYQDNMSMSKSAIYDQLISEYGEQFTAEEAQYAIDNLPD